ncbi:MAG: DUF1080 domain-containing protein, partial [Chloroflexota bacterium]
MRLIRISLSCLLLLLLSNAAFPQDQRTIQTKVADLLARFPANDNTLLDKLMSDMSTLGEEGLRKICDQVIPAGSGDDTKNRFGVESYSRYLTAKGREKDRQAWEKICIDYARSAKDNGVKDFFMKQLQWVGGDASVDAMKEFLTSKEVCEPALAVILASGGKNAETVIAVSLKNRDLPCAAAAMNALAKMKSSLAVNEYIQFLSAIDVNIRASALNALAMSGSKTALDALNNEAKKVEYHWEVTGAVAALLNYADQAGAKGDLSTMDKITKLVMSKTKDDAAIQNKTVALGIYTKYHGIDAMPLLYKAAANSSLRYRAAAMRFSLGIEGPEVVNGWINFYKRATNAAKPQLIAMFGERGDKLALPVINEALSSKIPDERKEAAPALAAISKNEAISALVNYMINFKSADDQNAAKEALMTVMRNEDLRFLLPVIKEGSTAAVKTSLELLAWKSDPKYFSDVFALTSSSNDTVKSAAIKALPALAGPDNQQQLIDLLIKTDNAGQVADLQNAVAVAAGQVEDPEKRSAAVVQTLKTNGNNASAKIKLVPVLAKTGGREALAVVLNEFGNGNADMRDASFKALTGWRDYSASSALYEILASGNKTFEGQAFDGYIRQVRTSGLPAEQKVLLIRKLMPFAGSPQRKNALITELGRQNTYQSLFFVAGYLDDPQTSAAAARAAMTIALPNANGSAGMQGNMVQNILTKAAPKLAGSESDYEREQINKYLAEMPGDEGFKPLFNGKDLTGWKGLVDDPIKRSKMKPAELAKRQAEADRKVPENWTVKDGCIWFNGRGNNLCTIDQYADFEMLADWKITKEGDSGIYLRGTPQVQIWDTSRTEVGAQVGSGGLYNNQKNPSKPLKVADNPVGEWNTFRIVMVGEKVSVWLNGELVVDNVTLENYWDRSIPIFPKEQLELQAHGTDLAFRDIYVREIRDNEYNLTMDEKSAGFVSLFNGRNLDNWVGNKKSYVVEDGNIVVKPADDSGGNLYTEKEYSDFIFRFEFQLTPAANNGLGIRAPLTGDAAYAGMELQILDDTAPVYAELQPYQYHGSVYGVIPAKKGSQKPVGEWNYEEVEARGTHIKITLNGNV